MNCSGSGGELEQFKANQTANRTEYLSASGESGKCHRRQAVRIVSSIVHADLSAQSLQEIGLDETRARVFAYGLCVTPPSKFKSEDYNFHLILADADNLRKLMDGSVSNIVENAADAIKVFKTEQVWADVSDELTHDLFAEYLACLHKNHAAGEKETKLLPAGSTNREYSAEVEAE